MRYGRRILALIFACLMTLSVGNAYSVGTNEDVAAITPRMEYINGADCYFYIQNETAYVNAFVNGYADTATKCEITVELQEKSFLFWNPVESWSDVQLGRRAAVNESIGVTAGKSYRTVTTVTVWSGAESESKTLTSNTIVA